MRERQSIDFNFCGIALTFLERNNIIISKQYLSEFMLPHPFYPSAISFIDFLNMEQIKYTATKVKKSDIANGPFPFLLLGINNSNYSVIINSNNDLTRYCSNETSEIKLILIETNQVISTKKNEKLINEKKKESYLNLVFFGALSILFLLSILKTTNYPTSILNFALIAVGTFLSAKTVCLSWKSQSSKETDGHSKFQILWFLNTGFSKRTLWPNILLGYFLLSFNLNLFFFFLDNPEPVHFIIFIPPISVIILSILILINSLKYFAFWNRLVFPLLAIAIGHAILVVVIMAPSLRFDRIEYTLLVQSLIATTMLYLLVLKITKLELLNDWIFTESIQYLKFKRNPFLINTILQTASTSFPDDFNKAIYFGESTAKFNFTLVLFPYCRESAAIFQAAYSLYSRYPSTFSISIIFVALTSNIKDKRTIAATEIFATLKSSGLNLEIINSWYLTMNLNKWKAHVTVKDFLAKKSYTLSGKNLGIVCNNSHPESPQIYLNKVLLPFEYSIGDLIYLNCL